MGSQENEDSEAVRAAYAEACRSYERIDDFRAKLLGFLPLVSGTGLFLLAGRAEASGGEGRNEELITLIGVFGFITSLGLLFYELRGIQRCIRLATVGASLEYQMGIEGRFRRWPNSIGRFINEPIAAAFVYSGILASWTFLFTSRAPLAAAITSSASIFVIAFLAVWRFYRYTTKKEESQKVADQTSSTDTRGSHASC